jgi:hypothetical protein
MEVLSRYAIFSDCSVILGSMMPGKVAGSKADSGVGRETFRSVSDAETHQPNNSCDRR